VELHHQALVTQPDENGQLIFEQSLNSWGRLAYPELTRFIDFNKKSANRK
jgi:hypothetical protein